MKKAFLFLCAACLLMGCERSPKGSENALKVNTITVEDSVQFPPEAIEEWMYDDMAYYLTVVDAPVTQNEDLRDNIINWISEFLSPNYDGDSQDVKAMVEFDRDECLDINTGSPQSRQQNFINLIEDSDRYVTYICDSYIYTGGAHGSSLKEGATFLKTDGTRFTYEMFKDPDALANIIKDGVETQYYASVLEGTDVPFEEALIEEALDDFPMPMTEPWVENDSIFFIYMIYEISAYSLGMPQCGFPYQTLKEHLTDKGLSFFE